MALRISGKHVDVGDALREHITDRIEDALSKYFTGGFTGHVTLSREGNGFKSECSLHLDTGIVLQVSAQDQDPRNSFDAAADKIEKRLRRYKRKLKDHHGHNGNGREALRQHPTFWRPRTRMRKCRQTSIHL